MIVRMLRGLVHGRSISRLPVAMQRLTHPPAGGMSNTVLAPSDAPQTIL
jgi:hypothetical protein